MIVFEEFVNEGRGLKFTSLIKQGIVIKIIDGYTDLCSYKELMTVEKNVTIWFSHPSFIYHRRFEIWDSLEQNILLKLDKVVNLDNVLNLNDVDKYKRLKLLSTIKDTVDASSALPIYEIFVTKIYDKYFSVNNGDVVMDIGGNIGLFSYDAICKGASKVYCFEPSSKNYNVINNIFKFDNLVVEESAVSSKDGYVDFYDCESNSIGSSMYDELEGSKKITCKSVNLNSYILNNNIEKIDYLKVDCEGAEYEIIESLDEDYLTNNIKKICLEYHLNKDGKINSIINKLKKCGFTINFEFGDYQINEELGIFYAQK
jgi:FkbM family methyltransferase